MSDELEFADEDGPAGPAPAPWIVMIVDDEPMLHESTKLAMAGFSFDGRGVQYLSCYSAEQAYWVLAERGDVALVLLDVVMENEHAGLDLARDIRTELGNRNVRIVLRTGQPGQAPEEQVIQQYDINDYKAKTELTRSKLVTTFYAALRAYRDLMRLERATEGLRRTIGAIREVHDSHSLPGFASALLNQLHYLLNIQGESLCAGRTTAYAACHDEQQLHLLAATAGAALGPLASGVDALPPEVRAAIEVALHQRQGSVSDRCFIAYHHAPHGAECVLYLAFSEPIGADAIDLLSLFSANVVSIYENLLLREEVAETQRSTIYLLGEAMEKRSRETGAHVRRVSEISGLLARTAGLSERSVADIMQAAPLHDAGKVGIPDSILNKPGKLDAEEWRIMQSHATLGYDILCKSPKRVLQLAAQIALQHHERWDGGGYPHGLVGGDIHLAGRIVALADVFDALVSKRCYKPNWTMDDAYGYVLAERGRHFDPQLVDALPGLREQLMEVYRRWPDTDAIH